MSKSDKNKQQKEAHFLSASQATIHIDNLFTTPRNNNNFYRQNTNKRRQEWQFRTEYKNTSLACLSLKSSASLLKYTSSPKY